MNALVPDLDDDRGVPLMRRALGRNSRSDPTSSGPVAGDLLFRPLASSRRRPEADPNHAPSTSARLIAKGVGMSGPHLLFDRRFIDDRKDLCDLSFSQCVEGVLMENDAPSVD